MNLQDVVDELAERIGRSVVINDLRFTPLAASAQGDEIDEVRARALLQRVTPPRERAHLESLRITQARRPMAVDLKEFGARERLAIPIWEADQPLAILWLITGGLPPLTEGDFRAIDAAVDVARPLIASADQPAGATDRDSVFKALLASDPLTRRDALSKAARIYGVRRGNETLICAVAVGYDTGVVQRAALGRALENSHRRRLRFLGEQGSALMFLVEAGAGDGDWTFIAEEARRAGVLLRAVGTAGFGHDEDDAAPAAERAAAAATVAEILPELEGIAEAEAIAPWLMIADIAADPTRLARYSPAAHALAVDIDPMRRETVETYLDNAGHVRAVCDKLHIHRTTLYYRLDNMPQIVKDALDDGLRRSALHIGLKLNHFWQSAGRI
ncbi:helix-turn-helix domain-containing protein [Microbacterium sp. CIAB417]|uniref:helix-turn-helix domain-containing protein n=1 Tax=Microbacterium sp. CIAB417 TaxID=2860287 RepID=UPI001FAB7864|nr:helix-turn-helix domain-containing protein [Microbacterium sp. CIAB417]